MASLSALHESIASVVGTVDGIRSSYPYPPQSATPPTAFVTLTGWQPRAMGRKGYKAYTFDVVVFTAQSVRPQDGYGLLMEFADSSGTRSVELALWDANDAATGTFDGLADTSLTVAAFEVLGAESIDAYEMYGGVFTVTVETKAT